MIFGLSVGFLATSCVVVCSRFSILEVLSAIFEITVRGTRRIHFFMLTSAMKLKDAGYKSHWNILVFCDQWKMISDLNTSHGKIFVSFPLFGFTLVLKVRNFDFESHWSTLIFYDKKNKKRYDVRFDYVHGEMSDFVSFPWFEFTLVIKLKHFKFESHWNTLTIFDYKKCQILIFPVKQCLLWSDFSIKEPAVRSKFVPVFVCLICIFWYCYKIVSN